MSLFEQIPAHNISQFSFGQVRSLHNESYVKSYFHPIENYLPYHTHDFYEINIVYGGEGKHIFGNREMLTRKGDVFIIPPYVKHGYSSSGDLNVYHILLSNLFLAEFSAILKNMRGYGLLFNLEPMLREHTDSAFYLRRSDIRFESLSTYIDMIEEQAGERESYEAEKTAQVLSLIGALSKAIYKLKPIEADSLPHKHALGVIEGIEYIEEHFNEKIDVASAASKSALSYTTFLRYFKKITGVTPTAYQLSCKIKNAVNLLLNTGDTILKIALDCGFYDSSHFIKEFIRAKGIPPSNFRKNSRGDG